MGLSAAAYGAQLQALLPLGSAWPRHPEATLTRLLLALAEEMARIDYRGAQLVDEALPERVFELLADWERVCGLPDTCSAGVATTLQERRDTVVAKLTFQGGSTKAYFIALAAALGYVVTIDEFEPFLCGRDRCGARLMGGHAVRYQWRVNVPDPRYTAFRTGVSSCGERLGKISRAEDLECKLKRLKPAHTHLIMSYLGA